LSECAEHVEKQATGGIRGVDVLVQLINLVVVFELVELHLQALSNRTDPRLADERHGAFSRVSSFLKLFEKPVMRH
jgi:hypothetical protein